MVLVKIEGNGEYMAELTCGARECAYNAECLCCKGNIMVGGELACHDSETCCESFMRRREGRDSFTNSMGHPSKLISIDCEAVKCVYNSNCKCVAEHVDIRGNGCNVSEDTACATFTKK